MSLDLHTHLGDNQYKSAEKTPMPRPIPFWTYLPEYTREKSRILKLFDTVLRRGTLILGQSVARFENDFAHYCNCQYGIGVNSGTDALFLSLKALGVGAGNEVITIPNSAIPTVSAIIAVGATPVFVDTDDQSMLMDPKRLEAAITKKTKCILPVHLYGSPANMPEINIVAKAHDLFVLEDCAQATGATIEGKRVGSYADIAAFSFYPTKIIGAYGDGGMIVTNSLALAKKARMLRMYGTTGKYYSYMPGFNSRLDEIQAALLQWKLGRIEKYIKRREEIARRYTKELCHTSFILPTAPSYGRHVWHLYVVRHRLADSIITKAKRHGVNLASHYRYPLHLQQAHQNLGYKKGDFPNAENSARTVISLPIYPELSLKDQYIVISVLQKLIK